MRTFLIFSFCLLSEFCLSQKNTVFVEFGGNGGVFSRNYERQLTKEAGLSLRLGVGFSFFELQHVDCNTENPYCNMLSIADYDLSIPFSVQYLINLGGANYMETGLGYTFQFSSSQYDEHDTSVYFASLGFRRHFGQAQGWMWKVSFTPILGITDEKNRDSQFTPWGAIAVGKRF